MTRNEFVSKYKVGDKIKSDYWNEGEWLEILFIGSKRFFAEDNLRAECSWSFDEIDWIPYTEPPKPKKTVKMARALAQNNNGRFYISDFIYSSKEEAISFLGKLIQWPLVINNEEQWIEVEVEE